jgi:2-amino-4-hydroxy-6-hydroxymethyldihydropteridine diphosphokinase
MHQVFEEGALQGVVERLYVAYIGLGSNLEPRFEHLRDAVGVLKKRMEVHEISAVYETAPFGHLPQPDFLNAVVRVVTPNGPLELLRELREMEHQLGRQERPRWHEREIDFDILFFDDLILKSAELTIPHPGIAERAFVLVPLAEIAPRHVHPTLKETIEDLLKGIDASGVRKTELTLA